jgi:hypothetical protein
MEFARMSAGGSSMLADLIAELEELRTVPQPQKGRIESPRQLVRWNSGNAKGSNMPQHNSIAIVGTVMPSNSAEEGSGNSYRRHGVRMVYPAANLLDIFV